MTLQARTPGYVTDFAGATKECAITCQRGALLAWTCTLARHRASVTAPIPAFRWRNKRLCHHLPTGRTSRMDSHSCAAPSLCHTADLSASGRGLALPLGSSATGSHRGIHCKHERWVKRLNSPAQQQDLPSLASGALLAKTSATARHRASTQRPSHRECTGFGSSATGSHRDRHCMHSYCCAAPSSVTAPIEA